MCALEGLVQVVVRIVRSIGEQHDDGRCLGLALPQPSLQLRKTELVVCPAADFYNRQRIVHLSGGRARRNNRLGTLRVESDDFQALDQRVFEAMRAFQVTIFGLNKSVQNPDDIAQRVPLRGGNGVSEWESVGETGERA